jgi:hypothetical protein
VSAGHFWSNGTSDRTTASWGPVQATSAASTPTTTVVTPAKPGATAPAGNHDRVDTDVHNAFANVREELRPYLSRAWQAYADHHGILMPGTGYNSSVGVQREDARTPSGAMAGSDPDFMITDHLDRFGERFGDVPDLVVEVVSDEPASRIRDYEDKRREYAAAGIAEYWIIDAPANRVLVLTLDAGDYGTAADRQLNEAVTSRLFPDFVVTVSDLLPTC